MRLREYLSFARRERRGVITLMILILLLSFIHRIFPSEEIDHLPVGDEPVAGSLVSGKKAKDAADIPGSRPDRGGKTDVAETGFAGKPGRYRGSGYPADDNPLERSGPEQPLFEFDPNTLSAGEWKKLGLGDRVIATIQRYTAKGGRFYQAQDLGKIYGLSKADYERLAPYAVIRQLRPAPRQKQAYKTYTNNRNDGSRRLSWQDLPKTDPRSGRASGEKAGETMIITGIDNRNEKIRRKPYPEGEGAEAGYIDINRADTGLLQRLPGIGNILAARIVMFRKKLGGFSSPAQLCEVYGLSEEVYRRIEGNLTCDSGLIRKININAEEPYRLRGHPYMKGYIAQTIINYRKQHGPFDSVSELRKINSLPLETLEKMLPYLSVR